VEAVPEMKRLVLVTFVAVAFLNEMFWSDELPVTANVPAVRTPTAPVLAKRLVEEAFVEKSAVVVTFVAVTLVAVRPRRLVFPRTVKVEVTVDEAVRNPPYN
jgi:hypothetical protein